MSTITQILIVAALVLSIFVPFSAFLIGERNKGRLKTSLAINAFLFFGIFAVAGIVSLGNGASALAAEAARVSGWSATGLATCCSSCNRSFLYRRWYRSCQCCQRCPWSNQRGSEHSW